MTEKEYRSLEIDSQSSIKDFVEDRRKYYKKYILKEAVKEDESDSLIFGNLVDCLQFTPDEYDGRYALSISQMPTGQYNKLVTELMKITVHSLNSAGEVTRDIEDMLEEAYNNVKYDRNGTIVDFKRDSFEVAKSKFLGSELETHYRQLRECYGKNVIELGTLENAQNLVRELRTNFVTSEIIMMESSTKKTVFNQFIVVGEMDGNITKTIGYPLKGMIDKLVIDHGEKRIYIYDLKTCWDNENEFLYNYFKYKYYIQMAIYFYLVVEWKKKDRKISDYAVHYPYFIVGETANYKNPLIYPTDHANFEQGMKGFIRKGKYYPGVIKAIQDIVWHKETGIWNISRDNYKNNGIVKIPPFE